jgi:sRNA-binding regulator protein Hfq
MIIRLNNYDILISKSKVNSLVYKIIVTKRLNETFTP